MDATQGIVRRPWYSGWLSFVFVLNSVATRQLTSVSMLSRSRSSCCSDNTWQRTRMNQEPWVLWKAKNSGKRQVQEITQNVRCIPIIMNPVRAFFFLHFTVVSTLRARQSGRHFSGDIFKCIFLDENICNLIKISLKYVPKVRNNNIPALFQIMAWRLPGNKRLSEPMMVSFLMHICVTRPQRVRCRYCLPQHKSPWYRQVLIQWLI